MNTVIQIPVDKEMRIGAEKAAERMGFGSIQDMVRLWLAQVISNKIEVNWVRKEPDEYLTPAEEKVLMRKWNQAKRDIKNGKSYTVNSVEEMMKILKG